MPLPDLVIRGKKVVLPDEVREASIHVSDGRITAVSSYQDVPARCQLEEAGAEFLVMPGLVDTHVHINEPGRTEWEGFATATRAAAAGGVTTLVDMPLNSIPPTTTIDGFREKIEAAWGQCYVDVGFWGGVIPGNTNELALLVDAGVVGFKCFLIHSGVDEFPNVTEADLRQSLPELVRLDALLIVHAELPGPINRAVTPTRHSENRSTGQNDRSTAYQTFLASRPREAENEAVELMINLGREFGARIHIVHHSSADALPLLAKAKASGARVTAETCPHYLMFAAEEIPDGATEFKCCPPIRERENLERLWRALGDGTIDMIVSDHSPCPPELKLREQGDFLKAWGGISSLQLRLPAVWTAARKRGFAIADLVKWNCRAPAKLAGFEWRKGSITVGADADIVIWNSEQEFRVEPQTIHHRHKLTPYNGRQLLGVVQSTFLRGRKVYDGRELIGGPRGILLNRSGDDLSSK